MLIRTHLAITILAILLFIPHVSVKIPFVIIALAATFIPDVDNMFSTLGKEKVFRFLQFFTKHRGILHSFSFCVFASLLLSLFWPIAAFPFFLAYALHLFADSFTVEGIKPFWPWPKKSSWRVRTGGRVETSILVFFVVIDVFVLIFLVM